MKLLNARNFFVTIVLFSFVIISCVPQARCGDRQCSGPEVTAPCGSPQFCFADCGNRGCYVEKTDSFVATRTQDQYKGLQQFAGAAHAVDSACLYENGVRNNKQGECRATSISQDNQNNYLISCICKWSEEMYK